MVQHYECSLVDDKLQIEGFPEAIAIKRIDCSNAKELQALILHQTDLAFSFQALKEIDLHDPKKDELIIEGLWISAIARFSKCFGASKSRSNLIAEDIFNSFEGALAVFNYFRSLRNKNIIHDENLYSQAFTGVVINALKCSPKVATTLVIAMNSVTVDDAHKTQLIQLVDIALTWVNAQIDAITNELTNEYEQWSHEDLMALEDIKYTVPGADSIGIKR